MSRKRNPIGFTSTPATEPARKPLIDVGQPIGKDIIIPGEKSLARLGTEVVTGSSGTTTSTPPVKTVIKEESKTDNGKWRERPDWRSPQLASVSSTGYRRGNPSLRFTPYAWAKLRYIRDMGDTEVGGFGICPNHPLLVEDFITVEQECSAAYVAMVDEAVADFVEDMVDINLRPDQFMRVWIHTHPGSSPDPSGKDEETFSTAFGTADWAVMFILAREGKAYGRLKFNTSPGGEIDLQTEIDWYAPFPQSDIPAWEAEYQRNVWKSSYPNWTPGQSSSAGYWNNNQRAGGHTGATSGGGTTSGGYGGGYGTNAASPGRTHQDRWDRSRLYDDENYVYRGRDVYHGADRSSGVTPATPARNYSGPQSLPLARAADDDVVIQGDFNPMESDALSAEVKRWEADAEEWDKLNRETRAKIGTSTLTGTDDNDIESGYGID